jgi:hypothetical protein
MEMKKLLETIDTMSKAEKKPEGAEFKGYWKGTDKSPPKPGQSVGGCKESKNPNIMRDLKSVADDKELEWKLSEEFELWEDNLGVEEKRPHRSGSREEKFGQRGHKEKPCYATKWPFVNDERKSDVKEEEDKPANQYYNPNPQTPKMIGMYFYDVPAGKEGLARASGLKQTKSGKWAITQYDTSGATFNDLKRKADVRIGTGKWWAPKQVSEGEHSQKYRSTISSFDRMSKMAKLNTELQKLAKLVKEKEGRIRTKTEINEFGATPVTPPIGTATAKPAIGAPAVDPVQAKNVAAATATLKSATSNPAAPTAIAKAINNASTGATVNAQDMKALAPMMGLVGQAAQDPKLANQFKSFAVQAQQAMKK